MVQDSAALWRASREIHSRQWADGAVIYDTVTGDTHHLTQRAFQILLQLQKAPCTLPDLAERLLSVFTPPPDAEDQDTIESIVLNLNALGLTEPTLP